MKKIRLGVDTMTRSVRKKRLATGGSQYQGYTYKTRLCAHQPVPSVGGFTYALGIHAATMVHQQIGKNLVTQRGSRG